jgi:hypothetical protein
MSNETKVVHKNIHEAIAGIYASVNGYVQKTKSEGLRYSFASEADLIAKLRPAMVENGVFVYVHGYNEVQRGVVTSSKGTSMNTVTLSANVRFVHGASGTHLEVVALGEGADTGDKAGNKAMTCAYKYALRQTFCIETGDDPDRDQDNVYQQNTSKPGEHPSWQKDQDGFGAWLAEQGLAYAEVAAFCRSLGKPDPKAMTNETRRALSAWLMGAGAQQWKAFASKLKHADPFVEGA